MAEDFDTLAAVAANALDHSRQWAQEPLQKMVVLHRQRLQELNEKHELWDASVAREAQEKEAHLETQFELDAHRDKLQQTTNSYVAETAAHKGTIDHRDELLAQLEETSKQLEDVTRKLGEANAHLANERHHSATLADSLAEANLKTRRIDKALRDLPRRYGHLTGCECFPCDFVRGVE